MPELSSRETLSYRVPRSDLKIYNGPCRRKTRLPNLSGLCLSSHFHYEKALSERRSGDRSGLLSLRFRLNDHRSVPFPFSLGAFSQDQSRHQDAHITRSAGIHSDIYQPDYRQSTRCQRVGYSPLGKRFRHRHRSWIRRLYEALYSESLSRFFRDSCQEQFSVPPPQFSESGQNAGASFRSTHCSHNQEIQSGLPGDSAPGVLRGSGHQEAFCLSDQYLYRFLHNRRRYLQAALAGGALLPLDQTTSENQNLLRNIAQRRQNPDLDRCQHLSVGCHPEEATSSARQPP